MKILLVVLDGFADRGKTPLEVAEKPNLNWLAQHGLTGLIDNGITKGGVEFSETVNFHLFGYKSYPGRGYTEALGAGLEPEEGDVCLRANFATVDPSWVVLDRRAGRDETGLEELAKELDGMRIKKCEIIFKKSRGHRAALILRGEDLSAQISATDPMQTGKRVLTSHGIAAGPEKTRARRTAIILNRFTEKTYKILDKHDVNKRREIPANIILARYPAKKMQVKPFNRRYGLKACCIAAVGDVIGVAKVLGMNVRQIGSGHVKTDLLAKVKAVKEELKKNDFVWLHIKGADEASHDRNFEEKKAFIERVDREVIKEIRELRDVLIVITADHVTSVYSGEHEPGYVPLLIYGAGKDNVQIFDENSCAKGELGILEATNLLERILALAK